MNSAELRAIDETVFDNKELRYNPEFLDFLETYNVNISTRNPHDIETLIVGQPHLTDDTFEAQWSNVYDQCIILEHGASHCSLLLGIDREGNVVSIHQPIAHTTQAYVENTLQRTSFMKRIEEELSPDRTFFLTATGHHVTLTHREDLLQSLENILGKAVNYLFIKEPEQRVSEPALSFTSWLEEMQKNVFEGDSEENDKLKMIGNIFIIPSYVSATGKTEIIIPYDPDAKARGETQKESLERAVTNLKQRLNAPVSFR